MLYLAAKPSHMGGDVDGLACSLHPPTICSRQRSGQSESASRPSSEFWCLNDKMIKELMTFAKCEIGKMSYKLH
jgi:hypothetical protein